MGKNAKNEEKSVKNETAKNLDVLIVGGGAAGLMAAITAAKNGAKTAILEHMEKTGKKILSTGNGKCNYTNKEQGLAFYRGEDPSFVVPVFQQFGFKETIDFFEELGVMPKEKKGYYYPASEQASAISDVLHLEANFLRIEEFCNCEIIRILQEQHLFIVTTNVGNFAAKSLIFATGLLAAPKSGSDGSAFPYIENFGHHFIDIVPALVPLKGRQAFFKSLAGIRAEVQASLFVENSQICAERGELQLTDYGVSGIPIFQLSRFATKALKKKQSVHILLDFLPDLTMDNVTELLEKRFYKKEQKKTRVECLVGLFPRKLSEVFLKEAHIELDHGPDKISHNQIQELAKQIKALRVDVIGSRTYEQAQVCAGGIDTQEIYPDTMESKLVKGLFFAGEIVDIDGMCGGYNLQWAWSSGYVAGLHASNNIRMEKK